MNQFKVFFFQDVCYTLKKDKHAKTIKYYMKSKCNEAKNMVRRNRFQERNFIFLMKENGISDVISHHKNI